MWNKVRYIVLTAQRDSLFFGLAIAILFGCYISFFLGSTALTEGEQMSLVYAAGISRVILVLGLIIFIAFHIRRSFENKEIELMVVHPISRAKFILSYWFGFSIVALFFVLFTGVIIFLLKPNFQGFVAWALSLYLESVVIVSLAMTASLILRSTVMAVMFSLGFYVLSRMAGFILVIVTSPGSHGVANSSFEHLSKLVPRLDFFGKTEWLVYGVGSPDEVMRFVFQAFAYTGFLLALSIIDFRKKQF